MDSSDSISKSVTLLLNGLFKTGISVHSNVLSPPGNEVKTNPLVKQNFLTTVGRNNKRVTRYPPPFRSYLGSARAQKYLQAFFCSLAWIFVTVPKCLNQVFLQQPLLAALVACCFLRGLQAVPAYAFEKPIFHLCWCLWLTCWPGVEADPSIVAHWIMSLLSYPLCALEVLWN